MSTRLPSGNIAFLFTDIEGSTQLAQRYPNEMPHLLARHDEILNRAIEARNGSVFQTAGDSFCVAFQTADDALNAALEAQRSLHSESWAPAPIRVRMGLHTGFAEEHVGALAAPEWTPSVSTSTVSVPLSTPRSEVVAHRWS